MKTYLRRNCDFGFRPHDKVSIAIEPVTNFLVFQYIAKLHLHYTVLPSVQKHCLETQCMYLNLKAVGQLYHGILSGCKKEGSLTLWHSMEGPGGYYAK